MEEAAESRYGEASVKKLADHYGTKDETPLINSGQLLPECLDLRVHLIIYCSTMSMKEVLGQLVKHGTTVAPTSVNCLKSFLPFLFLQLIARVCYEEN